MASKIKYAIMDNRMGATPIQTFPTKKACKDWLMEGLYSTEGAERDHFVEMLMQLESGRKTLIY